MVLIINLIGAYLNIRFDLTKDKRYTLAPSTKKMVDHIDEPLFIKVYLQGDFPAEFKRIQTETQQLLEEFKSINENIKFRFIDPNSNAKALIEKGLQPSRLTVQEDGKVSEAVIFPWAIIQYNNKEENVSLLVNSISGNQEEQLQKSIENLEFSFTDAIVKLTTKKTKTIAVLKGNGELDDVYLYSFLKDLGQYYKLAEFTLDSVESHPESTLKHLLAYDAAIIAKPKEVFTEKEKFTLDQYITNGGKTLWLIDNTFAEMDSLMVNNGNTVILNRDLGLTDQLFNYGVRIKYNLVKDMYSSTIRLASGNTGNQTQFQDFKWPYFPLLLTSDQHGITKNLDPIRLKFPSTIDTLNNNIKKTILLQSSPYTKLIGTPATISLEEIADNPTPKDFNNGLQNLGVLLEGHFSSAYANRVKPFNTNLYKPKSTQNKMVVVSDGDIIANETFRGEPIPLSQDKWTNQIYGNSIFLKNVMHFLLDDTDILKLRSKSLQIQFLDKEKAYQERSFWQFLNLAVPIIVLAVFGVLFNLYRRKKYTS